MCVMRARTSSSPSAMRILLRGGSKERAPPLRNTFEGRRCRTGLLTFASSRLSGGWLSVYRHDVYQFFHRFPLPFVGEDRHQMGFEPIAAHDLVQPTVVGLPNRG